MPTRSTARFPSCMQSRVFDDLFYDSGHDLHPEFVAKAAAWLLEGLKQAP